MTGLDVIIEELRASRQDLNDCVDKLDKNHYQRVLEDNAAAYARTDSYVEICKAEGLVRNPIDSGYIGRVKTGNMDVGMANFLWRL